MTGKLIFKMELFKFLRDKSFLIAAGVIGSINIILTLIILSVFGNLDTYAYYESSSTAAMVGMIGFLGVFLFFANVMFAYIYPFHMISMDYKNNVMAMMIASGVNRKKLFFSKIGAIFICTIALMLMLTLIPVLLCIIKIAQSGGWDILMEGIRSIFYYSSVSLGQFIFSGLISYLNMLMLIATACIIMKGKNLSFLVFIGFSMLNNFVTGILSLTTFAFNLSDTGTYVFQIFLMLVSTVVFGFISLKVLERQKL